MDSGAKRASIYLGVFMAVVMIAGIFLPYLNQTATSSSTTVLPTDTTVATFPPPPSNLNEITFDKVYLHPSGIFSIADPDGWAPSQPNMGAAIAQINLTNNDMLSVIDTYIEDTPLTTAQLSDHFNESVIASSWANFTTWAESSRSMQDDKLVIDFTVTLTGRTFVARQEAWTDGQWVYVVRVLTPSNATDLLRYLLDNFAKSLQAQTEFKGTPFDWTSYYDTQTNHIIRYPSTWSITDSAPGRPTSISSGGGVFLRVETRDNTSVADAAAASTVVTGLRSGVKVVTTRPTTRGLGQGFTVSYSYTTVDGSQQSGFAVLLNGPDNKLHIADLLFPASGIDLNLDEVDTPAAGATAEATAAVSAAATAAATAEATPEVTAATYLSLAQMMDTFYIIQPLNLVVQATPTPIFTPSAPVTTEETSSGQLDFGAVTGEATSEATAEATSAPAASTQAASPAPTTAPATSAPATSAPTTAPATSVPATAAPTKQATSTSAATAQATAAS